MSRNKENSLLSSSVTLTKFLAFILVTALLLPALLVIAPVKGVRANASVAMAAPASAPPEPFVIGSGSVTSRSIAPILASTLLSSANKLLAGSQMPDGLVVPNPPTVGERFFATFASLIALIPSARSSAPPPPAPASNISYDFDGDGHAEIGRWHPANTEFKVGGSTYSLGSSSAKPAPGDFNGDGKMDAGVFNAGTWTYKTSTGGSAVNVSWGTAGDIPVTGDYDYDGTSDIAIWRPSTGVWWIRHSRNMATVTYTLGASTDIPVPGDYDGDGNTDYAVWRPSNGTWYIEASSAGSMGAAWGASYDTPVQGDFDGDGSSDPTVYRPTTGTWYVLKSSTSYAGYSSQAWGNYADQPTAADYDGDGTTDFSIWRPTTGQWYTLKSSGGDETHTLGVPGDTAIPSSYTKQVGGTATPDVLAAARLSPKNATGSTDLYSQNFSWGSSLFSLPGRSGLDAGLGIGYNWLVWIKSGSAMYFNPDTSNAGPGFRFGLPVIEPIYWDDDKGLWSYMMVSPSGARTEFRQTTVSSTYEAYDSSYAQLVTSGASTPNSPVEGITITLKTTDGTQMTYEWLIGAYRCTKIKDRNGNYITAAYDWAGRLETLTDTLGRVITVAYDSSTSYPTTITQTWKGSNGSGSNTTHTWATLSYATKTVNTDFHSSITAIVGPPDDTVLTVLDKITYADASFTKFEYNDYIQVKKVSNVAADSTSHVLNYVLTNLASPSSSQTDCPRFTETKNWAENFNMSGGTAQEVVITNTLTTSASYSLPNSISGSATRINVAMTGHPDGLITKMYVGASGYKEGLPLATEDCVNDTCSGTDRKRWTWTDWTQDEEGVAYPTNPRVVESRVGDGTNTKKTQTEYHLVSTTNTAVFGRVKETRVYDTDLSTVLKKTVVTYEDGSAYTGRRLVGLPTEVKTYGWESTALDLMSRITYGYDYDDDFAVSGLGQNISPIQHDGTNFSASFSAGRGNLTSTTRWDVTDDDNSSLAISSSVKYNTAGSPVAQVAPWDGTATRITKLDYTDNFNAPVANPTYAYPTKIYDPAGNFSQAKYRSDTGANVWAKSPNLNSNLAGKETTREYDAVGRILKDKIENTGAYTRYEYFTNGIQSKSFSTIVDNDNDGADADDEVLTETWTDGAGRVRRSRTGHPSIVGGWTGTLMEYDRLGRTKRSTVPTEITVNTSTNAWTPAGDDDRGVDSNSDPVWLWSSQEYDWKGRVIRRVNTDGTDQLAEYEGCGCAGGDAVTVKGEELTEGRRTRKTYSDILGRHIKMELLDWNQSVYKTVTNAYNGRDQVSSSRVYAGSETSSDYQETSNTFDGHGRLHSHREPRQDSNAATVYAYFADDKPETISDARGAVKHYSYTTLGLIDDISWSVPQNSNITVPAPVSFEYDNVGNRIEMTDAYGTVV